jgi:hypothetical protein
MNKFIEFIKIKEQDVSSELLLKVQVALIVMSVFILFVVLIFTENNRFEYIAVVLLTLILILVSTLLNVWNKKKHSVYTLILFSVLTTWLPLLVDKNIMLGDIAPAFYLSLPILIASFFSTPLLTALIAVVQISVGIILISVSNTLQNLNWISFILFLFIITALSLSNNYLRYLNEQDDDSINKISEDDGK